ncbi:hypothetical protein M5K25_015852 [Dendrobium thyrsiflorum]|uniref:Uncharacterized protein n=1 Tax=Dendrobium thyrsiflorum TaxID=117978 RepID=A0ABD0URV5_DENTH
MLSRLDPRIDVVILAQAFEAFNKENSLNKNIQPSANPIFCQRMDRVDRVQFLNQAIPHPDDGRVESHISSRLGSSVQLNVWISEFVLLPSPFLATDAVVWLCTSNIFFIISRRSATCPSMEDIRSSTVVLIWFISPSSRSSKASTFLAAIAPGLSDNDQLPTVQPSKTSNKEMKKPVIRFTNNTNANRRKAAKPQIQAKHKIREDEQYPNPRNPGIRTSQILRATNSLKNTVQIGCSKDEKESNE